MWVVKAVYVLMNLVALGLGIWKVNGMGLLPYVDLPWFGRRRYALADIILIGLQDPIGLLGRPNENLSSVLYSPFDDLSLYSFVMLIQFACYQCPLSRAGDWCIPLSEEFPDRRSDH